MTPPRAAWDPKGLLTLLSIVASACSGGADNGPAEADAAPVPGPPEVEAGPLDAGEDVGAGALCTRGPAASLDDLTGTWILRTVGAQLVDAPAYSQPFHIKSVVVTLARLIQTGDAVTLEGRTCDRLQQDDPKNPGQVTLPDGWRLTEKVVRREGTFAVAASGTRLLDFPLTAEVAGAQLADPTAESLPTAVDDSRVFDEDNDGNPGISVNLGGLVSGTLHAVQRQKTALRGIAVATERVEGVMEFSSEQIILASVPGTIKSLYGRSKSYSDPAVCSSTFALVKVADGVDCAWVRERQGALFAP